MRLSSVSISEKSISQFDGNREIISISIKDIQKISLRYGNPVERLYAQVVIGITLLGLGLSFGAYPSYGILFLGYAVGSTTVVSISSAFTMILIGGWFILKLLIKEFYLLVESENDSRKIVFDSYLFDYEVRSFVNEAKKRYGLSILDSVE